jgi:hypothetical protein
VPRDDPERLRTALLFREAHRTVGLAQNRRRSSADPGRVHVAPDLRKDVGEVGEGLRGSERRHLGFQENLRTDMTVERREHQRVHPVPVRREGAAPPLKQEPYRLDATVPGRVRSQRGVPVVIPAVRVGSTIEQKLHDRDVTAPRGQHQRGLIALSAEVRVGSTIQQTLGPLDAPSPSGSEERRIIRLPHGVNGTTHRNTESHKNQRQTVTRH